jgi:hypothetical protein
MRAVKYLLIFLFLLAGSMFFYAGMGWNIPGMEFGNVASYGVFVASMLLLASVLIARYWPDAPPQP